MTREYVLNTCFAKVPGTGDGEGERRKTRKIRDLTRTGGAELDGGEKTVTRTVRQYNRNPVAEDDFKKLQEIGSHLIFIRYIFHIILQVFHHLYDLYIGSAVPRALKRTER